MYVKILALKKNSSGSSNISLYHYYITIISLLYHYYITIISLLYHYYITIISLLYHYYITIISLLYHYYITIISLLYHYTFNDYQTKIQLVIPGRWTEAV